MKLDSKSGATLAAAAATLFLAGAVVSTSVGSRQRGAADEMHGPPTPARARAPARAPAKRLQGPATPAGPAASRWLPKRSAPRWAASSSRADLTRDAAEARQCCRAIGIRPAAEQKSGLPRN